MTASYDLKFDRAQQHVDELESVISEYTATHPYEVSPRVESEGEKRVRRIRFTQQPPDRIAAIAGDFLHNVRSGLDHLACTLVPSARRTKVDFPIYFKGVWDPPVDGEPEPISRARGRWASTVKGMHDRAVEVLTLSQPDPPGPNGEPPEHPFFELRQLSNADKHRKLPVYAASLIHPVVTFTESDRTDWQAHPLRSGEGFPDGAYIQIPEGVVDVHVEGTPTVTVASGNAPMGVRPGQSPLEEITRLWIPGGFGAILRAARFVTSNLRDFDRVNS